MQANLIEAGHIRVAGEDGTTTIPCALLIECADAEQVREAMRTGSITFTLFHRPVSLPPQPIATP